MLEEGWGGGEEGWGGGGEGGGGGAQLKAKYFFGWSIFPCFIPVPIVVHSKH